MKVGVPKEVKNHEYRVAITPAGTHELVRNGHDVYVQQGAGEGSSIPDADFVGAGAVILPTADDVWQTGDLILKVKEPVAEEYHRMRKDQVLFTYLHLAASRDCTDALNQRDHGRHQRRYERGAECDQREALVPPAVSGQPTQPARTITGAQRFLLRSY
jgi:alanine dehydrogenase